MTRASIGSMVTVGVLAVAGLAACGEKAQTLEAGARQHDERAWAGATAGPAGYTAAGWKPGDQASWEAQLKARSQGQNDYARVPPRP